MLKDLLDWCAGLAAKDVINPIIGLIVGVTGMHMTRVQIARGDSEKASATIAAAEAAQVAADAATADGMTKRFIAILDGYERRVKDLTEEVTNLRAEVRENRDEIALLREELERARTRPQRPTA